MLQVMCVCGFGIGSSMLLKMNLDTVVQNAGLADEVEITPSDITTASGATDVDLIFTSPEISEELEKGNVPAPLIVVEDFIDMDYLSNLALPIIKEHLNK